MVTVNARTRLIFYFPCLIPIFLSFVPSRLTEPVLSAEPMPLRSSAILSDLISTLNTSIRDTLWNTSTDQWTPITHLHSHILPHNWDQCFLFLQSSITQDTEQEFSPGISNFPLTNAHFNAGLRWPSVLDYYAPTSLPSAHSGSLLWMAFETHTHKRVLCRWTFLGVFLF